MPLRFLALLLALAFAVGAPPTAHAAPTVRVIETWPAGDLVVLARNHRFHLRIAYASDEPIGIGIQPYFRGKPARTGTSPSPRHSGSGETSVWFFGNDASAGKTPPAWVTQLGEQSRAAAREQARAAADAPMSAVDTLLFVGPMAAPPIAPLLGFAAPIRAYRRWRSGWRIAAAVPGIMMALVVLRIAVSVAIDPTQPRIDPAQSVPSHVQRH